MDDPRFSEDEDLSLCRNYVIYYPERGEERRMNGVRSMSYLGKIHDAFFIETSNPHNWDHAALFCRFMTIKKYLVDFIDMNRIVTRYRLRGDTEAELGIRTRDEWRRWKQRDFEYEAHYQILKDFLITRMGC